MNALSVVRCILLLALAACGGRIGQTEPVTLAITNARVWTADAARPWATALAIRGDRIVAVGADAEINALVGANTRVIDARGQMVVPGFIDSHIHFLDGGRWADKVIGAERSRTTYAFRSVLDAGATLAFGSDWFVAPPTPLEGIYAAVTRRTLDNRNPGGWVREQKITVEDALRAYTTGSAYAEFAEDRKGSLAPGKLADIVLIDRDITRIPGETIRDARVVLTVVGGRVVFERDR